MKPEQSFDSENSAYRGDSHTQGVSAGGGVTGMFETLTSAGDPTEKEFAKPAAATAPPPASAGVAQPPFVQQVVVQPSAFGEASDPLLNLLRSSPPADAPVAAQPAFTQPAITQPPAAPAAGSSAGFTQLLRALNQDQFSAPPVQPTAPATPPPLRVDPPPSPFPTSSASSSAGSVTQLLRTLDEPAGFASPAAAPAVSPAQAPPPMTREEPLAAKPPEAGGPVTSFSGPASVSPAPSVATSQKPSLGGSFTQLFQALDPAAAPVAKTPAAPSQAGVGGAFGQEASAAGTGSPVPAPPQAPGSFTQLFRALDSPVSTPPKRSETASQGSPDMFRSADAPLPATDTKAVVPVAAAATSSPAAGSFTQMFQALEAQGSTASGPAAAPAEPPAIAPPPAPEPAFQEPIVPSPQPAVQVTAPVPFAPPPVAPAPPGPGAFTQMLNATELSQLRGTLTAAPPPAATPPPAVAAAIPAAVVPAVAPVPAPPVNPTAPAAGQAAPASFTQLFSAENFPSPASASQAGPGATFPAASAFIPHPSPQTPSAPAAGGFTQLFKALDTPVPGSPPPQASMGSGGPITEAFFPSQPVVTPQASSAPAPPAGAGGFTQLFRSLDTPQEPTQPPRSTPMPNEFGAQPMGGSSSQPPSSGLGASQMFSSYAPPGPQAPASAAPVDFGYAAAPKPAEPVNPPAKQGGAGLTQLLQTLQQPTHPTVPAAARMPEPSSPSGGQGLFTSTYQGLNAAGAPPAAPQPFPPAGFPGQGAATTPLPGFPAPSMPAAPSSGPSEFTRILNASALREAGLRSGGAPAAAVPQAPAAGGGAPAMPAWATPQMPSAPAMPTAPSAPAMPSMPAMPQFKAPEAKAAEPAAPQTKLQQYTPLLLILVVFLLVAILIAVIFMIKR